MHTTLPTPVAYRGGGVQTPTRNSEDIGGVLDRRSKKNRRLDFLLYFNVFSYGCNLLNKVFFNTNCLAVAYLVSEFKPTLDPECLTKSNRIANRVENV